MPPIYVGGTELTDLTVGGSEVNQVYAGSRLVWERKGFPWEKWYNNGERGAFFSLRHSQLYSDTGRFQPIPTAVGGAVFSADDLSPNGNWFRDSNSSPQGAVIETYGTKGALRMRKQSSTGTLRWDSAQQNVPAGRYGTYFTLISGASASSSLASMTRTLNFAGAPRIDYSIATFESSFILRGDWFRVGGGDTSISDMYVWASGQRANMHLGIWEVSNEGGPGGAYYRSVNGSALSGPNPGMFRGNPSLWVSAAGPWYSRELVTFNHPIYMCGWIDRQLTSEEKNELAAFCAEFYPFG